jgi:hypothetical protein
VELTSNSDFPAVEPLVLARVQSGVIFTHDGNDRELSLNGKVECTFLEGKHGRDRGGGTSSFREDEEGQLAKDSETRVSRRTAANERAL